MVQQGFQHKCATHEENKLVINLNNMNKLRSLQR